MPAGGIIPPDGRPPQAKGVGKTARRHDLEAPKTPGLHDSDLQQGDVSMLEQGQKVAPPSTGKMINGAGGQARPAAPQGVFGGQPSRKRAAPGEVPDPIQMLAGRAGGQPIDFNYEPDEERLNIERWAPLMREIARNPRASGPLTTALMQQLANLAKMPNTSGVQVIDQNAAERAMWEAL